MSKGTMRIASSLIDHCGSTQPSPGSAKGLEVYRSQIRSIVSPVCGADLAGLEDGTAVRRSGLLQIDLDKLG